MTRTLLLLGALGGVVGFIIGLLRATVFVLANRYAEHGMTWLLLRSYVESANGGILRGLVAGVTLGLIAWFLLRPLFLRFSTWLRSGVLEVRTIDARRTIALAVSFGIALAVLVCGWILLNHYFIPWPYHRRYWVLNGGLVSGCIVLIPVLYRLLASALARRGPRPFDRPALGALAACVVLTVGLNLVYGLARPRPAKGTPSVFLLTVDTLRAGHLGCYGYPRDTSPQLDRLAGEGRLFLRAFSHAPVTSASFSCIMTGLLCRDTRTYGTDPLPLRMNTLAEYFQNAGYRTGAVVSNYVLVKGKNYEFGFDEYDDRMEERELVRPTPERIGKKTTAAALAWLEKHGDRPFFLWVHYQDPHGPYAPPREYQTRFLDESALGRKLRVNDSVTGNGGIPSYQRLQDHREYGYYVAQYDGEIRYFDDSFHDLVTGIRKLGHWNGSLVFFTSDHGEGMGENDYYFAHGENLLPVLLHVPLIVWGPPDLVEAGARDTTQVQLTDVPATVLSFAGLTPSQPLAGRNLFDKGLKDAPVFSECLHQEDYSCSVIEGNLQVLYDRVNDDLRAYDLAAGTFVPLPHTPEVAEMERSIEELGNLGATFQGSDRGGPDRAQRELLRSLGYIR